MSGFHDLADRFLALLPWNRAEYALASQLSFGSVVLELVHNVPSASCMARKLESPEDDPFQLMARENPGNDYLDNRKMFARPVHSTSSGKNDFVNRHLILNAQPTRTDWFNYWCLTPHLKRRSHQQETTVSKLQDKVKN